MEPNNTLPTNPVTFGMEQPPKRHWSLRVLLILLIAVSLVGAVAWLITHKDTAGNQLPAATVTITEEGFVPSTVKIAEGQQVMWVNEHDEEHQVASDPDKLADLQSGTFLSKGESYSYPFDGKGTFSYYDPADPTQYKGQIIVE